MNAKRICSSCGAEILADAPAGLCVPCALKCALPATEPLAKAESPQSTILVSPSILASEKSGDRIGRYKLLQEIGEGGMGTVWMAEQEEPVRRRVALKVIKLGMDTKQVIGRFEAERQALALMDHPNIAKVFDAGATDNGRPYFVMELVKGIPITKYCDDNRLGTEKRLELFMDVCHAIQHAHQKSIIHRDIKPSNILIANHDGRPVPKVIDFGIAKATDQKLTEKTVFTAFEQFIGTPAYMSPEQAEMNALDIDTRTDIYALGVLLYELLTGKTPFDAKELISAGLEGMRKMIREKEPARPSTRISSLENVEQTTVADQRHSAPPQLIHRVRGDLDWVTMKCLEKDRSRRYETANGLGADIERHMKNEPVVARPPSNLYRFQKFARRNKLAFASATAIATALIIGLGISSWMFLKERAARTRAVVAEQAAQKAKENETQLRSQAETNEKRAKAEAAKSQHVSQFLKDMLRGVRASVALGRDTTMLREILDQTNERVWNDLDNEQDVQIELGLIIARTYENLEDNPKSAEVARKTLQVARSRYGEDSIQAADAMVVLARALFQIRKLDESKELIQAALPIQRKYRSGGSWEEADALRTLANVLRWSRKSAEAETAIRESVAIMKKVFGNDDREVALALNNLSLVLLVRGNASEAEAVARESLAILQAKVGDDHPDTGYAFVRLGGALEHQNKLSEAEIYLRKALEVDAHVQTTNGWKHALSLWFLDSILAKQDRWTESETCMREAVALVKKLGIEKDPDQSAEYLLRLGQILEHNGKKAESEQFISEATNLYFQMARRGNPRAQTKLGWIYENGVGRNKDLAQATEWYEKAAATGDSYARSRSEALRKK